VEDLYAVAYRVALGIVRDEQDAREIAQEAIARYRAVGATIRSPVAFVAAIARNLARDVVRRRRVRHAGGPADIDDLPSAEPPVEEALDGEALRSRVRDLVGELPPAEQAAVRARYFEDGIPAAADREAADESLRTRNQIRDAMEKACARGERRLRALLVAERGGEA
jgi:RNA polymerase sigma factor (sigma-70 family)